MSQQCSGVDRTASTHFINIAKRACESFFQPPPPMKQASRTRAPLEVLHGHRAAHADAMGRESEWSDVSDALLAVRATQTAMAGDSIFMALFRWLCEVDAALSNSFSQLPDLGAPGGTHALATHLHTPALSDTRPERSRILLAMVLEVFDHVLQHAAEAKVIPSHVTLYLRELGAMTTTLLDDVDHTHERLYIHAYFDSKRFQKRVEKMRARWTQSIFCPAANILFHTGLTTCGSPLFRALHMALQASYTAIGGSDARIPPTYLGLCRPSLDTHFGHQARSADIFFNHHVGCYHSPCFGDTGAMAAFVDITRTMDGGLRAMNNAIETSVLQSGLSQLVAAHPELASVIRWQHVVSEHLGDGWIVVTGTTLPWEDGVTIAMGDSQIHLVSAVCGRHATAEQLQETAAQLSALSGTEPVEELFVRLFDRSGMHVAMMLAWLSRALGEDAAPGPEEVDTLMRTAAQRHMFLAAASLVPGGAFGTLGATLAYVCTRFRDCGFHSSDALSGTALEEAWYVSVATARASVDLFLQHHRAHAVLDHLEARRRAQKSHDISYSSTPVTVAHASALSALFLLVLAFATERGIARMHGLCFPAPIPYTQWQGARNSHICHIAQDPAPLTAELDGAGLQQVVVTEGVFLHFRAIMATFCEHLSEAESDPLAWNEGTLAMALLPSIHMGEAQRDLGSLHKKPRGGHFLATCLGWGTSPIFWRKCQRQRRRTSRIGDIGGGEEATESIRKKNPAPVQVRGETEVGSDQAGCSV